MKPPDPDPSLPVRFPLFFFVLALFSLSPVFSGCATREYQTVSPEEGRRLEAERAAEIAAEPRGDYYIGRRYFVRRIHAWGYLRRPGKPWSTAKVVIMNESSTRVPDRLPEYGTGKIFGYDHNSEYRVRGAYTGRLVYDPNANARLPEFRPTSFELVDGNPGFLFKPGQRYNPGALPPGLKVEPR